MAKIKSLNPATGQVVEEIEAGTESDVRRAVEKARKASPAWARLSFQDRARYILAARNHIRDHLDEFARLLTEENGKPLPESLSADLFPVMELATYFAKNTEKILRREKIWLGKWSLMGRSSAIEYHPLGVVGIISPWNYPFSIPCGQVMTALMAGNSVILKPSEFTPRIGLKIGEIFEAIDLPSGVLQVIPGDGSTGAALVNSGVDKILFTGSVSTGKKIMEAASKTLTPVGLELGGKDPMIVLEDADLEVAASGAVWGSFSNAGQTCSAVERLYVHEKIAEPFIQRVLEKTRRLRQAEGSAEGTDVGPMSSEMQLSKVSHQVEEAKKSGAQVLTGGTRDSSKKGFFYPPTILTHVDHSMEVMREETFGPVVGIMTFKDDDEAVRLANDSKYGLTTSVWTRNIDRGRRLARQIDAGTVMINENLYTYALPQTPWGGPKESGIGRTHGKLGLLEMVKPHHLHINRVARIKDFWWYSYDQNRYEALKSLAEVLFAKGILRKLKKAARFLVLQFRLKNL